MLAALDKDPSLRSMKAGDGTAYDTREELEQNPDAANVIERMDDHCTTAYGYMDRAHNSLGPIAEYAERIAEIPSAGVVTIRVTLAKRYCDFDCRRVA